MLIPYKQKERIYDLMNGQINLSICPFPESEFVSDEFAEGSTCSFLYTQTLEAYSRICQRLGAEDLNDQDVEDMMNHLLALCKHLSLKMFDYGVYWAEHPQIHATIC